MDRELTLPCSDGLLSAHRVNSSPCHPRHCSSARPSVSQAEYSTFDTATDALDCAQDCAPRHPTPTKIPDKNQRAAGGAPTSDAAKLLMAAGVSSGAAAHESGTENPGAGHRPAPPFARPVSMAGTVCGGRATAAIGASSLGSSAPEDPARSASRGRCPGSRPAPRPSPRQ
jgi:hypothetical protein